MLGRANDHRTEFCKFIKNFVKRLIKNDKELQRIYKEQMSFSFRGQKVQFVLR